MDLELQGKVVAITGGTDGLGLALADRLVELGARAAVCGRNGARLQAARTRWGGPAAPGGPAGPALALADRLVELGARVAVCGRNEERLTAARTRWESAG